MNENIETKPKFLAPFKRFCMTIGELPTSYVETMTYYEMLLWFTKYLSETVIPAINNNAEALEEVQKAMIELQEYVENYFENLDVQEEINNKLDEMAEDGTLAQIIGEYYAKAVLTTNDLSTLIEMPLTAGNIVKVMNKEVNDNLSSYYKIFPSNYEDIDLITLTNGLKAKKLYLLENINEIKVHFPYRIQNGGDCIIIEGNKNVIIDIGIESGVPYLINYLINNEITKIDYLIITHVHGDHIGGTNGLTQLLNNQNIDFSDCKFILNTPINWNNFIGDQSVIDAYESDESRITALGNSLGGVIYPTSDTKLYLDSDNYLEFYNMDYPSSYYTIYDDQNVTTSLNNFSLVTKLTHRDKTFLFTADIENAAETNILNEMEKVDVLKVMHHGANLKDNINFLNILNPTYSVIMNTVVTLYQRCYTLLRRFNTTLYTLNESRNVVISTNQNKLDITSDESYLNPNMGDIILNGEDLNDFVLEGTYRVKAGSGTVHEIANAPVTDTNFLLTVEIVTSTYEQQRIYQTVKTNTQKPLIYSRCYSGYGWSEWQLSTTEPWVFLELKTGYTGFIRYAKSGSVVHVMGELTGVFNSGFIELTKDTARLPERYRPVQELWAVARQASGNTMRFVYFTYDGKINLLDNLGEGTNQIRFSATFIAH